LAGIKLPEYVPGFAIALALFIIILLIFFNPPGHGRSDLRPDTIELPPGFRIDVYAGDVPGARSMALSPNGTLFVGTRDEGKVYAITSKDAKKADEVITIASGLHMPNGVAFRNGSLYVAEVSRILRYDDIEARLHDPPEPVVVYDRLPADEWHGWKFIRFGPDGKLYVPIGAPCNICEINDPYATITRMNPDGSGFEIYARGIRNTVGFDWDGDGGLWFTDNGRDYLGEDLPPDELDHAPRPGMDFGFPHCYGNNIPDPAFDNKYNCSGFTPPAIELGPHVAPLGMRFYRGDMFPAQYQGQIFIAEHGSWNRQVPIGYRIALVRLENGTPVSSEVFADGWLQNGTAWGRPVDVEVMHDGSLLVSDDKAGAIYRISYG
jgi:glucose/arabinose dehydrogenase